MQPLEIPPDATVFKSQGVTYFMYLGQLEMVALQREWGLQHVPGEPVADFNRKCLELQLRCEGGDWADRPTVARVCLGRWAAMSANGSGPVQLTEEKVVEILDNADLPSGRKLKKYSPHYRVETLWQHFRSDMLGLLSDEGESEEKQDPKAKARKGSTPSDSSPKA
jgi:hypothetical protein